jgi:hypothetical protein
MGLPAIGGAGEAGGPLRTGLPDAAEEDAAEAAGLAGADARVLAAAAGEPEDAELGAWLLEAADPHAANKALAAATAGMARTNSRRDTERVRVLEDIRSPGYAIWMWEAVTIYGWQPAAVSDIISTSRLGRR